MTEKPILEIKELSITYPTGFQAIKNLSAPIYERSITSVIGSSGCGKTTLLRALNRMHELYPKIQRTGKVLLRDKDIYEMNPIEVRRRIGMVFHNATPFPKMSIAKNVLAGYMLNRVHLSKENKEKIIQENLNKVGLWEEIKDQLDKRPAVLTEGQQQRLCIARTIALKPDIILMDNPTSTIATYCVNIVESLIHELKEKHTILLVPNSITQAARISDYIMYIENGTLIEYNTTNNILANPQNKNTEQYITGQI